MVRAVIAAICTESNASTRAVAIGASTPNKKTRPFFATSKLILVYPSFLFQELVVCCS